MALLPPPKHHSYPEIPTLAQWEKDSPSDVIPGPRRNEDPALVVVDGLVGALERVESHGSRCYRLAELFFATMWWMNHRKDMLGFKPGSDATRRTAMLRLNLCAANKLALMLWCPINELARELQDIYGVGMSAHGIQTDGVDGAKGDYLSATDREKWRVIFRKGLAYHFPDAGKIQYQGKPVDETKLRLFATGDEKTLGDAARDSSGRFGIGFVMSMSGDLYSAPLGMINSPSYHSSLLGGRPVLCAGTICFVQGMVTRICNDSGHYKPVDTAMAKVLQRLRMWGVNLTNITVVSEVWVGENKSVKSCRGDLFLATNGDWNTIEKSGTRGRTV